MKRIRKIGAPQAPLWLGIMSIVMVGAVGWSPVYAADSDNDGIEDFVDSDDDNDGIPDVDEGVLLFVDSTPTRVLYDSVALASNMGALTGRLAAITGCATELSVDYEATVTSGDPLSILPIRDDTGFMISYSGKFGQAEMLYTFSEQVDAILSSGSNHNTESITFLTPYNRINPGVGSSFSDVGPPVVWHNGNEGEHTTFEFDGVSEMKLGVGGNGLAQNQFLTVSGFTNSTCIDTDGDGIFNHLDSDSDNDGISDALEAGDDPTNPIDTDGDGIPNFLDGQSDADNDGLADSLEGAGDTDDDGVPDYLDTDSDDDGIPDQVEGGSGTGSVPDTDGDGVPDYRDLDSDGDGLSDANEGVADIDGDGIPNFMDQDDVTKYDTDGDGISDTQEGLYICAADVAEVTVAGPPGEAVLRDGTKTTSILLENGGLESLVGDLGFSMWETTIEPIVLTFSKPAVDIDLFLGGIIGSTIYHKFTLNFADGTSLSNADFEIYPDAISPGSAINSFPVLPDSTSRLAVKGQSVDGSQLAAPIGTTSGTQAAARIRFKDSRAFDAGNGVVSISFESTAEATSGYRTPLSVQARCVDALDTDTDGKPDYLDDDSDNDGIADSIEVGDDPANPADADGDGIPNYLDGQSDADDDGVADSVEGSGDMDADGVPDYLDHDSDNDGIPDLIEAVSGTVSVPDTDGDGLPDYLDVDSDNDGISDAFEGGVDTDADGVADFRDLDSDNDGIFDIVEAHIGQLAVNELDANLDGAIDAGNAFGANGLADALEDTVDSGGENYEFADSDDDGVFDYQDLDSDNDGLFDVLESNHLDADLNGMIDGAVDPETGLVGGAGGSLQNSDNDGAADFRDLDSDNDGLTDAFESFGFSKDQNGDGVLDGFTDSDGDGVDDATMSQPTAPADSDNDSMHDAIEVDADADGIADLLEAGGVDADGNGMLDDFADDNNDGLDDGMAAIPLLAADTDEDGLPDFQDLDSDNDGISDLQESGASDADNDGRADGLKRFDALPDENSDGLPDYQQKVGAPALGSPLLVTGISGGGCSLIAGDNRTIDPLLPSLLVLAMLWIGGRARGLTSLIKK